ncbi:nesprin-1-like, partial [Clupea harengus]|uniref:Nesprin-1-like n=1 Tax=Clupea harengus TaxID=7950 RepID=A0A8M1KGB2_CLUHA
LEQQKAGLRGELDQWMLHKRACEEVGGFLMEGRYSLSRLRLLTGSLGAVQTQVESLEALQGELEAPEGSLTLTLAKLTSTTQLLLRTCHPCVSDTLTHTLTDITLRWNGLLEQVCDQCRSSKALRLQWRRYQELHTHTHSAVRRHEEEARRLLTSASERDVTGEEVAVWIQNCCDLLAVQESVQASLQEFEGVAEQLRKQVDPCAMATFHSDHLSLTQRLATVEHALCRQQSVLQCWTQESEGFVEQLDSLTQLCEEAEQVLRDLDLAGPPEPTAIQDRMGKLKTLMLNLSSWSPDVERLNDLGYRLPLSDHQRKHLQGLNRTWNTLSAHTIERYSKLQATHLQRLSFLEKCEAWLDFLSCSEERLAVEISGNHHSLLQQQKDHKLFQAEMFSRQQILYSITSDGHRLLNQKDSEDFGLKVALLSHQWQGVVRGAQQRQGVIDSLLRQWEHYRHLLAKLLRWLDEAALHPHTGQQGAPVALQQARRTLDHIQLKERLLQRQQSSYILVVEAGRTLLLSVDSRAEASLQAELSDVQERWRNAILRLDERKKDLHTLLKVRNVCVCVCVCVCV